MTRRYNTENSVITRCYLKGKLGTFPFSDNRLRAARIFIKDYERSMFCKRITFCYDAVYVSGTGGKNEPSLTQQESTDRYLNALKALDKFKVYAIHFLRDDRNVNEFISKYPILNKGKKRTYKMVYFALNKMLDELVDFYDTEKQNRCRTKSA